MSISSKDIVLDTLKLKKTPRIPVALLSGGAWTLNRRGLTLEKALLEGPERIAEIIAETNESVNSDIVWVASGYHNLAIRAIGGNIKFRAKGTPDVVETLIKNPADIATIDLNRLGEDESIQVLWNTAKHLTRAIGDKTLVGSSMWGPFTLAGLTYGVENIMRNIYKNRTVVNEVLEFTSQLCYKYLEKFIDNGVGIVSIADPNASGDMISREQFKEFSLPYLKKVIDKVKQRGVAVCVHICGNITSRLDLIPESGADVISLDYKVDLRKAKELVGNKMAFAGNMNPVGIMQASTPDGVTAACNECIARAGEDSSFILMPGCDIPPAVPLENIQTMVKTAWNYSNNV